MADDGIRHIRSKAAVMDQRSMYVFIGLYVGYMIITYIRKSVSFASPALMEEEHLSKSQFGFILSSQMSGYMIGKFLGGVMVDLYCPSRVFAVTLLLAAFTTYVFTAFDSVVMFALCWCINGLSQGPCWPACALIIKRFFPADSFGTWWSVLSTSMNVSGAVGPIVSAFLVSMFGWRFALNMAGTGALVVAGLALVYLRDCPQGTPQPSLSKDSRGTAKRSNESWRIGVVDLLKQPAFVATALNYLLVSLIRGACTDWGHLYLIHDKHHSRLTGSSFISCQELGGIVGSLAAGFFSDFLLTKKVCSYSPRQLLILFCTILQSAAIFFFITVVSSSSSYLLVCVVGFCVGFGVYGSIALFGVVAMESASDRLAGTAHSIVALAASVGLVISGYPLSLVAKEYSWHGTFCLVQLLAVVTTIISLFSVLSSPKATDVSHTD